MKQVTIRPAPGRSALADKALELLRTRIESRSGARTEISSGRCDIALDVRPGIGEQGFQIDTLPGGGIGIAGGDDRGLIYGVGKFLRTSRVEAEGFEPSIWRGASVPRRPLRGIYFASHFFNYYHAAPVEDVCRYVEDLALWGCNALAVWFDMHHFAGLADPAAQQMLQRLRAILAAAKSVGMGPTLTTLANEGYADSPENLRADWTAGHDGYTTAPGGHYHVEICPSKPGGLDYITRTRREMLDAFTDLGIEYVWLWPYDQGGCTCGRCAPWGANGFVRTCRELAPLIRRHTPGAKIIVSTWYFDRFTQGEWEGFDRAVGPAKPDWADYILADDYGDHFPAYPLKHGVPGGLPMVNFPEISMYEMGPWGGYGANPLPRHIQRIWDASGKHLAGGFPYSEGIFEDLNKAVSLQHYWSDRDALDTVREYLAYEASPGAMDDMTQAVEIMEQQNSHSIKWFQGDPAANRQKLLAGGFEAFTVPNLSRAAECLDLIRRAETKIAPQARDGWRWQILKLRAEIDAELAQTACRHNNNLDALFARLETIFHAQKAESHVCPPSRKMFLRCIFGG